eukprot:gene24529-29418_t
MNVLLAEADVSYDAMKEMDDINDEFSRTDVTLVIGANDVTNPAARNDPSSPIHGMPILNVDQSKSVIVLKRSMNSGFAGIENPLFFAEGTSMLFGDAKKSVSEAPGPRRNSEQAPLATFYGTSGVSGSEEKPESSSINFWISSSGFRSSRLTVKTPSLWNYLIRTFQNIRHVQPWRESYRRKSLNPKDLGLKSDAPVPGERDGCRIWAQLFTFRGDGRSCHQNGCGTGPYQ